MVIFVALARNLVRNGWSDFQKWKQVKIRKVKICNDINQAISVVPENNARKSSVSNIIFQLYQRILEHHVWVFCAAVLVKHPSGPPAKTVLVTLLYIHTPIFWAMNGCTAWYDLQATEACTLTKFLSWWFFGALATRIPLPAEHAKENCNHFTIFQNQQFSHRARNGINPNFRNRSWAIYFLNICDMVKIYTTTLYRTSLLGLNNLTLEANVRSQLLWIYWW